MNNIHDVYAPDSEDARQDIEDAYREVIDHHLDAFDSTPVLMLGIGTTPDSANARLLTHATERGAGWRVDCWGDWGYFSPTWNHQEDDYPAMLAAAEANSTDFPNVWTRAPIHLEVCGTLPNWAALGWEADDEIAKSFAWATHQHASLLNAKWTDIPEPYVDPLNDLLQATGHRFAISAVVHPEYISAGDSLDLQVTWENYGSTPAYRSRPSHIGSWATKPQ